MSIITIIYYNIQIYPINVFFEVKREGKLIKMLNLK